MPLPRLLPIAAVLTALLGAVAPAEAQKLRSFEGAVHEHTAYSDGEPGSRPAEAFAAVRERGSDFMVSTEHSDTFELPIGTTNTPCLGPRLPECLIADDEQPEDSLRKWDAIGEQAAAATTPEFAGIRGFEWTNDRHGHLNVLFSANYTNAKRDGGYADMATFWDWFTTPPEEGGGADGLGIFNHPGRREVGELLPGGFISPFTPDEPVPGGDWDGFRHIPEADERMVGMELFNEPSTYGDPNEQHLAGSYGEALDAGWHVGAIGAEDVHDTEWGLPDKPKTVVLARRLDPAAMRRALERRRFYGVLHAEVRLAFRVQGRRMGARLRPREGRRLRIRARSNVPAGTVELVTSGGTVVASSTTRPLRVTRRARPGERWFFVRVRDAAGDAVAYSSPVWVTTR